MPCLETSHGDVFRQVLYRYGPPDSWRYLPTKGLAHTAQAVQPLLPRDTTFSLMRLSWGILQNTTKHGMAEKFFTAWRQKLSHSVHVRHQTSNIGHNVSCHFFVDRLSYVAYT
jgi:hypothetical protein